MSNHIVCGFDSSRGGDRAAAAAAMMAYALGHRAVLARVVRDASGRGSAGPARLDEARERRKLHAVADRHGFPAGTAVRVTTGHAPVELLATAEDLDAELIVVGSRGLLELGSVLLGSVATSLMREAPCPVLVVPPRAWVAPACAGVQSVVCGVEGSERDVQVLRLAADLGRRLRATLYATHAFSPRPLPIAGVAPFPPLDLHGSAATTLERALVDAGVMARPRVLSSAPAAALERVAGEEQAGLIVVASQGEGKLGSILHGSVTVRLAAKGPVPVLVLPPQAELEAGSGHYEVAAQAA